jgi:hypothetical protein
MDKTRLKNKLNGVHKGHPGSVSAAPKDHSAKNIPPVSLVPALGELVAFTAANGNPRKSRARSTPANKIEEHIGRHLKTLYNDVLAQPVPNRFLELMDQLNADALPENVVAVSNGVAGFTASPDMDDTK